MAGIDRFCLLKECARNLAKDYGREAYDKFLEVNPQGRLTKREEEKIMGKQITIEQKRKQARIRDLGCIVHSCGGPAALHHAGTGAGGRKDEDKILPLCYHHHQGDEGIHTLGRKKFGDRYGTEEELLRRVDEALGMP